MVAGGHLATGSPRPHASKVVPAPAESLLFSDALKAWQMPSSNSVLPSLNNSGYASGAPPGDLNLCVASFWIQKITFMGLSQKLLIAGDASHLFLFPFSHFKKVWPFLLGSSFLPDSYRSMAQQSGVGKCCSCGCNESLQATTICSLPVWSKSTLP